MKLKFLHQWLQEVQVDTQRVLDSTDPPRRPLGLLIIPSRASFVQAVFLDFFFRRVWGMEVFTEGAWLRSLDKLHVRLGKNVLRLSFPILVPLSGP